MKILPVYVTLTLRGLDTTLTVNTEIHPINRSDWDYKSGAFLIELQTITDKAGNSVGEKELPDGFVTAIKEFIYSTQDKHGCLENEMELTLS